MVRRIRYYIYLRDVFVLAVSAFGGPQAHIAMLLDLMVVKRGYLTEEELIELNALCQILPGPTSTQTITAIGFKIGGPNLAYLTLLVWITPAVTLMTIAAMIIMTLQDQGIPISFTKYIQPMAVGFIAYAAYRIGTKVIKTKTAVFIMVLASVISYFFGSPYVFPLIIVGAGLITSLKYEAQPKEEKIKLRVQWSNFILWIGVLLLAASLGGITSSLPIRLFENFYRNGSLIFGGGQVLIPFLYNEFVEGKEYLDHDVFLSGYSFVRSVPGPVFSFSAYVGAIAMKDYGLGGQVIGAISAALGVFLPGTFLIFFVIRFWEGLKKYRVVRASLEGVSAASSGLVATAAIVMFESSDPNLINFLLPVLTFLLLLSDKIPSPVIILVGLGAGFLF